MQRRSAPRLLQVFIPSTCSNETSSYQLVVRDLTQQPPTIIDSVVVAVIEDHMTSPRTKVCLEKAPQTRAKTSPCQHNPIADQCLFLFQAWIVGCDAIHMLPRFRDSEDITVGILIGMLVREFETDWCLDPQMFLLFLAVG